MIEGSILDKTTNEVISCHIAFLIEPSLVPQMPG
jgi:hypothetical protein